MKRRVGLLHCMRPEMAHRDLASRIHFRNAPKADKPEPTRMTPSRSTASSSLCPNIEIVSVVGFDDTYRFCSTTQEWRYGSGPNPFRHEEAPKR